MNKIFTVLLFSLFFLLSVDNSYGALTGTKTIPGDYATIAAAIVDLNSQGVGSGGVIFNIAAGYNETLTAALSVTAIGTTDNPIIFQKSGSGANPLLTAYAGTFTPTSATYHDDMWRLVGSDYVSIDGIDLLDSNVDNPATMEGGFVLYKANLSNGAQNNTIKNCVITLNRVNNVAGNGISEAGAIGIIITNSIPATANAGLIPTTFAGTNSYNKFYSNTIQNCNYGIACIGYNAPSPFTAADTENDIGGSSVSSGNTIINFGGVPAAATYSAGIKINNQWGINISYNSINNNDGSGFDHPYYIRGIQTAGSTSANVTIDHNIISLHGAGIAKQMYCIDNQAGSTAAGNTVSITNNTIQNCSYSASATSDAIYGIYNTCSAATINISNNTITNNSLPATSGNFYGISNGSGSAASIVNVNTNIVSNNILGGTGMLYGIDGGSGSPLTMDGNAVNGNQKTGAQGTMYLTKAGTTSVYYHDNNVFDNSFTASSGTTNCILYGYYNGSATASENIYNNNFYNLSVTGTNTATASVLNAIHSSTVANAVKNIYGNNIYNLSALSGTVNGIYQALGTDIRIYKNNIYNLSNNTTGTIATSMFGITIASGTVYIYNNYISDLKTPFAGYTDAIRAINITSASVNTSVGLYYNTIFLNASSSGINFGTSGIFHTSQSVATTVNLDMWNNIVINSSIPAGTGKTVTLRRSSTSLGNYSSGSNNNVFYAGIPSAAKCIYYAGTDTSQIMNTFKTKVSPRESNSFYENPPFINISSAPYNLHIDAGTPTQIEMGGAPISSPFAIIDDYDGNLRNASTPDVGADEFVSTPFPVELSSFSASVLQRDIILKWETKTEVNSNKFIIERSEPEQNLWTKTGEIMANGNSMVPKHYSYSDKNLKSVKYCYRLNIVDKDGFTEYSPVINAEIQTPKTFDLSQNYPNPFNPSTRIDYQLPLDAHVVIELCSVTGEKIAELVNGDYLAGYYIIDMTSSLFKNNLASGIYIYRMIALDKVHRTNFVQVKKMMMLK